MDLANSSADQNNLPLAKTDEQLLIDMIKQSDLVFVGMMVSLGKPTTHWSGNSNGYQPVQYQVEKILKGRYEASTITVEHILVYGSRTAQEGETPHLSRGLFAEKSKLIISAQKTADGAWKSLNEELGALPANDEWMRKFQATL
jgi:hypothetical protein